MVPLRWDWLGPSVTVPFVPTIGPVHPDAFGPSLFSDVIGVAGTERFLAYDEDRRWFEAKTQSVLVDDIVHRRHEAWFPVLSRRGAGSVTVYVYGGPSHDHQVAEQLASRLRSSHGAATAFVVYFVGSEDPSPSPPTAQITSVQFQEFTSEQGATVPDTVHRLDECAGAVDATFASFVRSLADEGFALLHGRMAAARVGPVLVAVDEDRIVGALGPMEIMSDSNGSARLLPPYFAVLPGERGRGHGRALWRAEVQWGQRNGAAYQVVQTEVGRCIRAHLQDGGHALPRPSLSDDRRFVTPRDQGPMRR